VSAFLSVAPWALALLCVWEFDRRSRRLGLDPPGFRSPGRRAAGLAALALCLGTTTLSPIAAIGAEAPTGIDYSAIPTWQLFVVHALFLLTVGAWWVAGFAGSAASLREQVGLTGGAPLRELAFGAVFGIGAWVVVLAGIYLVAIGLAIFGAEDALPSSPPGAVVWLAGQAVGVRIALALSAGVVEEIFFRGLLQPRIGYLASTALFALAHLAYGQPFLLVGVTMLSLIYGALVIWRQSVWAAIAAHAVFDLVQLLVVVPTILRVFGGSAAP